MVCFSSAAQVLLVEQNWILIQPDSILIGVTLMVLRDEICVPCRDGGPTLSKDEQAELLNELIDWRVVDGHHLYKRLTFANFVTALGWLNRAGAICEEQGHHGDFRIGWGYLEIEIHTHKAGGLTRADAVLAAKFDALKQ
jgi:4a-hydroxytetrahydrobiopterin dehydratase